MIDIVNEFLGITFTGSVKPTERFITGLHTFDNAFINDRGELGIPLGKIIELYGKAGVGKSTVAYSLAGIIASITNGNIALADLEDFDPRFLASILHGVGYSGSVYSVSKDNDEDTLDELVSAFYDKKVDYPVGILDAVGAISPISERDGDLGEANMGRRAKLMAQFSRKALHATKSHPDNRTLFMINHEYPKIGGMGNITPGGEVKTYASSIRIRVNRLYIKNKVQEFPDGSYVIHGKVIKNKWGLEDNEFYLFMRSGQGIHKGLTAVYDALQLGLATVNRTIRIGDETFGTMKSIVDKADDHEFFIPFLELFKQKEGAK